VAERAGHDPAPRETIAWRVFQLEELLQHTEQWIATSLRVLAHATEKCQSEPFVLRQSRLAEVRRASVEVERLATEARTRLDEIPNDVDLRLTYAYAGAAAVNELARGTIRDTHHVLLAARIAPGRDALAALASGLRATDAYRSWEGLTLKDLLRAFDGMTPQAVRLIVTDAGLAPGSEIATCEPADISRLATRIEDYVRTR